MSAAIAVAPVRAVARHCREASPLLQQLAAALDALAAAHEAGDGDLEQAAIDAARVALAPATAAMQRLAGSASLLQQLATQASGQARN